MKLLQFTRKKNDLQSNDLIKDPASFIVSQELDYFLKGFTREKFKEPEESEEFIGLVHVKMIEDDYRRLRAFTGRSKRTTYLYTIWENLAIDFLRSRKGRNFGRSDAGPRPPEDLTDSALLLAWGLIVKQHRPQQEVHERLRTEEGYTGSLTVFLEQTKDFLPHHEDARITPGNTVSLGDEQFNNNDAAMSEATQDKGLIKAQTGEIIQAVLAELTPVERQAIHLHYWQDMPIATIAKMFDLEPSTLRKRLKKVMEGLRKRLSQEGIDPGTILR